MRNPQQFIDDRPTLAEFNRDVVPLMKSDPEVFRMIGAAEAKRRGYRPDKLLGIYTQVEMKLTKGRNIIKVGWSGGNLYAEFASGPKLYTYPDVPHEDYFKLLRSIYPDSLFAKLKNKWANKIGEDSSPRLI